MPVLSRPITVPRAVLLHVWRAEGLGDPHPVLGGFEYYVPDDREDEFTRECFRALAELGLADGEALTREFRQAMRLIAGAERELYCWSAHADRARDRRFLVGAGGRDAVAMEVRGDAVSIVGVDERRLVEEFVHELPEFPPAPVRDLTVARRDFEQRDAQRDTFASRPSPAQDLAEQLAAPREAIHQVYAAKTSKGSFHRSKPFSLLDLPEQGRVLVYLDGYDNLHRLPGTPGNLATALVATWQRF